MCLVLFAFQPGAPHPLVVAANRDEFYARPALAAHFWDEHPDVLGGRDLEAGGTWLGVHRSGRFAAVTNFAEAGPDAAPASRGQLTEAFLRGTSDALAYARAIDSSAYRGFNLILYDGRSLVYRSSLTPPMQLDAGVYGLANAELGARWPKVVRGETALESALNPGTDIASERLLALLADNSQPPDNVLPRRGKPLETERQVAPCFINGKEYGTRASTVVLIGERHLSFTEQAYLAEGRRGERVTFNFPLGS
jgi:uncharacterized protein with NRDE domain